MDKLIYGYCPLFRLIWSGKKFGLTSWIRWHDWDLWLWGWSLILILICARNLAESLASWSCIVNLRLIFNNCGEEIDFSNILVAFSLSSCCPVLLFKDLQYFFKEMDILVHK